MVDPTFDPEKPYRLALFHDGMCADDAGEYINWDEYAQLLEMYKELKWMYDGLCK